MAKAAPFVLIYAKEFLIRTSMLSCAETGCLVSLACHCSINGPVPDNRGALIAAMRINGSSFEDVWPAVSKFCRMTPNGWVAALPQGEPETASERRRDRLRDARKISRHTKEQWVEILASYAYCVRCGATGVPLEKDHIVPLFMGGSDGPENLQPLCRTCNCSKGGDTTDYRLTVRLSQVVS